MLRDYALRKKLKQEQELIRLKAQSGPSEKKSIDLIRKENDENFVKLANLPETTAETMGKNGVYFCGQGAKEAAIAVHVSFNVYIPMD